jgi:predicted enzyme related to lactoylglutathione lyase
MNFKMSPNVAVRTQKQFSEAVDFYSRVFGFKNRSNNPELADFDANPINLFVLEDDEFRGPVLELFVEDLEEARKHLEENGCKILRWRGKGQDCYIEDPFGARYNIWEQKE